MSPSRALGIRLLVGGTESARGRLAEAGAKVALPDLGGDLMVDEIYAGVAFAATQVA